MTHITVVYARRDEPQSLVDGMRANLSWCDDFVEVQRPHEASWNHEGETRRACREAAADAEWTLWMAPDERLEDRAGDVVRKALNEADRRSIFAFPLRELWTPTAWRADGLWGSWAPTCRIFQLLPQWQYMNARLHCSPTPYNGARFAKRLDVHLYHLKNIEPANREQRRRAYLDADPHFSTQAPLRADGWDYLVDETGLEVREIEPERSYSPLYVPGEYHYVAPGR